VKHKLINIFVLQLFILFFTVTPAKALACTYNSSINNNHLDIQVRSNDWSNLGILEIISNPNIVTWGKMYQPSEINWITSWDNLSGDVFFGLVGGVNKNTAYWGFNGLTTTSIIPYGLYGVDFSGNLTHQTYYVQMNHPEDVGTNYVICTRNGEVELSTPSPTSTPVPNSKVIFAPGLGASWNADAILNCNIDEDTGIWNLASYAEEVYNPILQAIQNQGWTTLPFYYDWRKNISVNSTKLSNFIDEKTNNEKVNLIGHSMGGLVGRGYLETSSGGKLASMLTIGTPNKGSVYAYPPWEGGDVWNNNLLEKIALTIYLKHCGGLFSNDKETIQNNVPSLQDLLPLEPYLKNKQVSEEYLPEQLINRNNWLETLSDNTWNVKLGYIAGTGIDTLQIIQTKDPNKKDVKENLWVDGKPAGKIISTEGDGTVLLSSAILPNATFSAIINQNHRNLVNSVEGMGKILEFLEIPESLNNNQFLTSENYSPDSALVIIGYPANFIVTDQNKNVRQDKDGMIGIMNPKSGKYRVNILSKSNNTLFIVAQFLPNGEVKYKEYNFKGVGPKYKTLNFDSQNPQEDILTP